MVMAMAMSVCLLYVFSGDDRNGVEGSLQIAPLLHDGDSLLGGGRRSRARDGRAFWFQLRPVRRVGTDTVHVRVVGDPMAVWVVSDA